MDEVLARFREASPEVRVGIRRALEVSEAPDLGARLLALLKREDTDLQAQVLEALAFRQEAPPEVLARFFIHDESRARMVALRAASSLSEDATRRLLPALLDSAHSGIRAAAMEAGVASGVRVAWDACRQAARSGLADSPEALTSSSAHRRSGPWASVGGCLPWRPAWSTSRSPRWHGWPAKHSRP